MTRSRTTVPCPSAHAIRRERLADELDRAVERGIVLVVGGPGWGKTWLVSSWAQEAVRRGDTVVGWVTAEKDCDDPRVLWSLVVAALADAVPGLREPPAGRVGPDYIDEVLARIEAVPGRCTLVLEDLHEVRSAESLATVDLLLAARTTNLRVVLVSRTDPALGLHRLRLEGELAEFRTRDLALTPAECAVLLGQHGVTLGPGDLSQVVARTEGWAAGLRLAAVALHARAGSTEPAVVLGALSGASRVVGDYLVSEVLNRQPERLRDFLLRTSVVDRVDAGLACLLAGDDDAAAALDHLERRVAFVEALDDGSGRYRYHRLFAEMCRHQLSVRRPALLPTLHARAAAWFQAQGEPAEALHHAVAAQDWSLVGRIAIGDAGPLTFTRDGRHLRRLLRQIPAEAACGDPWAAVARALGAVGRDTGALERQVELAERLVRDPSAGSTLPAAVLDVLRGVLLRAHGRVLDAVAVLTRAEALLVAPGATEVPALPAYRAWVRAWRGECLLWAGDLAGARFLLGSVLDVRAGEDAVTREAATGAAGALALGELLRGRVRRAEDLAATALPTDREGDGPATARSGWPGRTDATPYVVRAAVGTELGDGLLADEALSGAARELGEHPDGPVSAALAWARVRRAVDLGQSEQADRGLDELRHHQATLPQCRLVGALLADEVAERAGALDPHELPVDADGDRSRVEAWVRTALHHEARRRDDAALRAVGHALDVAARTGVVRPLARAVDPLSALLQRHARVVGTHPELVERLSPPGAAGGGPLAEPLTDRELSVLRLLPTMMSNAEIGAELFVSVNTVKAHLKAIYRKLGAETRREAVVLARDQLAAAPPLVPSGVGGPGGQHRQPDRGSTRCG